MTLYRATNPRTGGYHPKNWTLDSDTLAVPFFDILYGILVLIGAFMCLLCLQTQALTAGHNQSPLRLDKPREFLVPHGVHLQRTAARNAYVSHGATGS